MLFVFVDSNLYLGNHSEFISEWYNADPVSSSSNWRQFLISRAKRVQHGAFCSDP